MDHHEEMEAHYASGRDRQDLDHADEIIAGLQKRLFLLSAAVALCMNDSHLTDLGTLKRTWFYAQTGRDEPVGSLTWEELRVMVRQHEEAPSRLDASHTTGAGR